MSNGPTVLDHPVLVATAQAGEVLTAACRGELWRLGDDEVESALAEVIRVEGRAAALRAALVREAADRSLRERTAARSTERWLSDRFAVSRTTTNSWVRDATTLARHPILGDALAAGDLSTEQALALAAQLDRLVALDGVGPDEIAAATALLLAHAPGLTPAGIATGGQTMLESLTRLPDRDDPGERDAVEREADRAEAEARQAEANRLRVGRRSGGRIRGSFDLGPTGLAALVAWLRLADRAAPGTDGFEDTRLPEERRGDALVAALLAWLGDAGAATESATTQDLEGGIDQEPGDDEDAPDEAGPDEDDPEEDDPEEDDLFWETRHSPEPDDDGCSSSGSSAPAAPEHGEQPARSRPISALALIAITVTLDELRAGLAGAGQLMTGGSLSAATLRRMACDARIVPAVLGSPSQVLDLGRSSRPFSTPQKRAIALRDRGCVAPGCDRPPSQCDCHHGWHWADGGPTDVDNGFLLCDFHHSVVHNQGWTVALAPNGYPHLIPPPTIDPLRRPRQHLRFQVSRLRR